MIRLRSFHQLRVPFCAFSRAARPVTWGVAIDVPEKKEYVLFGVVLRMLTPGAPTETVRFPKFENEARASFLSVAATAMTFGRK